MMRSATLLGLLVLILGFAGCGGDGALRGEAEMKEVIAAGIRADEVLYNPGFSKEKGEAVINNLRAARKKLADLQLTDDEMKKLKEKYKNQLRPSQQ
ncbi:MAG: hypothetical protein FJ271_33930 [Planctomycetes bacterium]|nr:hypothetical protein [Planctomycetota bacterium]